MRALHTLMPMAGEGSRFLNVGCRIPKPLIRVEGLYLFQRALIGLADIPVPRKYTFIVRAEHIRNYGIDMRIRAFYPDANIISVEKTTRGAAETCLLAADYIAPDDALVVQDCDLEFKSADFVAAILSDLDAEPHVAGRVVSFEASSPRYSYAEIDGNGKVLRTAEKVVISNHALAGAYYFAKGDIFLQIAKEALRRYEQSEHPSGELYLSLLYNILLEQNKMIQLHHLDQYRSFGTPEELKGVNWSTELDE